MFRKIGQPFALNAFCNGVIAVTRKDTFLMLHFLSMDIIGKFVAHLVYYLGLKVGSISIVHESYGTRFAKDVFHQPHALSAYLKYFTKRD